MESLGKPDTTTGNGPTATPILASESGPTAEPSKQSPPPTSIESGSTKPLSLPEALSLLQTNCFDLRSLNCEVAILARNRRIYVIVEVPPDTGNIGIEDGHITLNSQPVSKG